MKKTQKYSILWLFNQLKTTNANGLLYKDSASLKLYVSETNENTGNRAAQEKIQAAAWLGEEKAGSTWTKTN